MRMIEGGDDGSSDDIRDRAVVGHVVPDCDRRRHSGSVVHSMVGVV
jgi:hypothetical protein